VLHVGTCADITNGTSTGKPLYQLLKVRFLIVNTNTNLQFHYPDLKLDDTGLLSNLAHKNKSMQQTMFYYMTLFWSKNIGRWYFLLLHLFTD